MIFFWRLNRKMLRPASGITPISISLDILHKVPTKNNPDGLPVGMVKDEYNGKIYMGFNCAACHTSQINYQGVGLRIDGGPAASDMENFLISMLESLQLYRHQQTTTLEKNNDFTSRCWLKVIMHQQWKLILILKSTLID